MGFLRSRNGYRKPTIRAAVLLVCLLLVPAIAIADPFRNGSFETSTIDPGNSAHLPHGSQEIIGWTVLGDSIDYVGTEDSPSEGARSIDLIGDNSVGGIEQSFDTLPGATYLLTFAMAGHPMGPPTVKIMTVTAGNETERFVFDASGKTLHSMGWVDHQMTFVAGQPTTTIKFQADTTGQGCCFGPMLDNVRVIQLAPTPSTWGGWRYLFFLATLFAIAATLYARQSRR